MNTANLPCPKFRELIGKSVPLAPNANTVTIKICTNRCLKTDLALLKTSLPWITVFN